MIPPLWLCADLGHTPPAALVKRVLQALTAGPAVVWLRAPGSFPARKMVSVARTLQGPVHAAGGMLLVGDRLDVAVASGADGVHLPSHGLTVADARRVAGGHRGTRLLVSAAVHDAAGMTVEADALVLSPFGTVPGKGPPLGRGGFAALRALAPGRFVVALGGITDAAGVREALAAGADGIAVRRALLTAVDPAEACAALAGALTTARGSANPSPIQ